MHLCTILALLVFPIMAITSETSDMWRRAGRMTGLLLSKCFWADEGKMPSNSEQLLFVLRGCLQRRGLKALYKAIGEDVIQVADGVELVKYKEQNFTNYDRSVLLPRSYSSDIHWKQLYINAFKQLFGTHILKIRLKSMDVATSEGRGRRRQNMFSQLLMFGLIAAAFIVIPMGFQFLAILGGKALLLAKMALLLTSIQGLKKIATSNFNYGLYSTHGQNQPCKTFDYPGLLDVFLSFDVESLRGGGYGYFDGKVFCLGQYDRQWPLDGVEGQQGPGPNYGNYDGYDYLHPRIDVINE